MTPHQFSLALSAYMCHNTSAVLFVSHQKYTTKNNTEATAFTALGVAFCSGRFATAPFINEFIVKLQTSGFVMLFYSIPKSHDTETPKIFERATIS